MILVLAYSAVLLSFFSGLLGLMMHQRRHILLFSQYWFKKFPSDNEGSQSVLTGCLEARRFPVLLRQAVFVYWVCPVFCGIGRVERVDR